MGLGNREPIPPLPAGFPRGQGNFIRLSAGGADWMGLGNRESIPPARRFPTRAGYFFIRRRRRLDGLGNRESIPPCPQVFHEGRVFFHPPEAQIGWA
jgi:hypothetical protein